MKLPVESNAVRFSYRKALIASVALVACSSTSVATAKSVPEDAVRTSRALNELNSTYTLPSVHGYLNSAGDEISSNEERMGVPEEAAAKLIQSLYRQEFDVKELKQLGRLIRKFDEYVPKSKDRMKTFGTFESEKFRRWITKVEEAYPESQLKVNVAIYTTLASRLSHDDLTNLLSAKLVGDTKELAGDLLRIQVQSWKLSQKTDKDVFALLKLDMIDRKLFFESPAFSQWVLFVMENDKKFPREVYESLYSICYKHLDDWDVLLAGTPVDADAVLKLRSMQIDKWVKNKKTPEDVFKLLEMDKTEVEHLFKSPAFSQWVSFAMEKYKKSPREAYKSLYSVCSGHFEGNRRCECCRSSTTKYADR